jgi:hypothetical protein
LSLVELSAKVLPESVMPELGPAHQTPPPPLLGWVFAEELPEKVLPESVIGPEEL